MIRLPGQPWQIALDSVLTPEPMGLRPGSVCLDGCSAFWAEEWAALGDGPPDGVDDERESHFRHPPRRRPHRPADPHRTAHPASAPDSRQPRRPGPRTDRRQLRGGRGQRPEMVRRLRGSPALLRLEPRALAGPDRLDDQDDRGYAPSRATRNAQGQRRRRHAGRAAEDPGPCPDHPRRSGRLSAHRAHRRKTAELIGGASLTVYPGSGHGLYASDHDTLNGDLLAFINGRHPQPGLPHHARI
jgi:hypothetical protein